MLNIYASELARDERSACTSAENLGRPFTGGTQHIDIPELKRIVNDIAYGLLYNGCLSGYRQWCYI